MMEAARKVSVSGDQAPPLGGDRAGAGVDKDTFPASGPAPWPYRYIGRPYDAAERDCATLVEEVLAEVFGVTVSTPGRATSHGVRCRQLGDGIERLARPVATPADGDVVLMARLGARRAAGRHIGVWWQPPHAEGHVLHALPGVGAALHPVSRLAGAELRIVGTYRVTA